MVALLGPPPQGLLARGNLTHKFFSNDGEFKPLVPRHRPIKSALISQSARNIFRRNSAAAADVPGGKRDHSRGGVQGPISAPCTEDAAMGRRQAQFGEGTSRGRVDTGEYTGLMHTLFHFCSSTPDGSSTLAIYRKAQELPCLIVPCSSLGISPITSSEQESKMIHLYSTEVSHGYPGTRYPTIAQSVPIQTTGPKQRSN